ncbi:E1 ubiquitin-activating protein uba2 [Rhizophlyctis rosea]|nr:E1 ubiquitin-activating protein uba2 [Rhizophlyctis rosea]
MPNRLKIVSEIWQTHMGDGLVDHISTEEQLEYLRKESEATGRLRAAVGTGDFGKMVMQKVFRDDIEDLLRMKDKLTFRKPPTPMDVDTLVTKVDGLSVSDGSVERDTVSWEQRVWTAEEATEVFLDSIYKLGKRFADGHKDDPQFTLSFDKDDDAAMDFVAATANLRAHIYDIEKKSRWEAKQMAGSIIPAIATTNAVISGLIVIKAIRLLDGKEKEDRNMYLSDSLITEAYPRANPRCAVCQTNNFILRTNVKTMTLGRLVDLLQEEETDGSDSTKQGFGLTLDQIESDGRILWDPDMEDLVDSSLETLKIRDGSSIQVSADCDDPKKVLTVDFLVENIDAMEEDFFELIGSRPLTARLNTQPEPEENTLKRKLDETEGSPSQNGHSKKAKTDEVINLDDDDDGPILIE